MNETEIAVFVTMLLTLPNGIIIGVVFCLALQDAGKYKITSVNGRIYVYRRRIIFWRKLADVEKYADATKIVEDDISNQQKRKMVTHLDRAGKRVIR